MTQSADENASLLNHLINTFFLPKQQEVEYLTRILQPLLSEEDWETLVQNRLDEVTLSYMDTKYAYLGTKDGDMLISPEADLPADYDPRIRPWYQEAIANPGDIITTAPYEDASTGDLIITVAKSLNGGAGVVGVDIDISVISQIVQEVKIGERGYPFILDKNRGIVVHPTLEVGEPLEGDFVDLMYADLTGYFHYVFNGVDKEMAFRTNDLTGWKIGGALDTAEVTEQAKPILLVTMVVILITAIVCTIIVYPIIKPIIQSLRQLVASAEKISEGDLTERVEIKSQDELGELGQSFNKMSQSIRSILLNLNQTSDQLSSSAEVLKDVANQTNEATLEVNRAIQEVAEGSESQVHTSQESARAMEEMALGIQRIAESSSVVSEASTDTSQLAEEGNQNISKVMDQMNTIHSSVGQTFEIVSVLGTRSSEIGQILEVITGISEQTNLLALNAAIEAARAGENGRGFAVVADEVRKLAEESKRSADQISVMIREIQAETQKAVEAMEQGKKEVDSGTELAQLTGENFIKILQSIQHVATQIEEVSAASQEMSAGAEQVTASFEHMSGIAEDSSRKTKEVAESSDKQLSAVEEILTSAEHLSVSAKELKKEITKFKL